MDTKLQNEIYGYKVTERNIRKEEIGVSCYCA